jgi:microcystin-dependent protein
VTNDKLANDSIIVVAGNGLEEGGPVALGESVTLNTVRDTKYTGGSQAHNNMQPYLAINYIIALVGLYPSRNQEPFIGEIRMFGGTFAPRGWALCDGQLLSISTYTSLFSILGTTYGGDGRTTFALPDLRGRAPIHAGTGPGLSPKTLGQKGGTQTETLSIVQMPSHNHTIYK